VFDLLASTPSLGSPTDPAWDVTQMRIGTLDELAQQACLDMALGAVVDQVVQRGTMRNAIFRTGVYASPSKKAAIEKALEEARRS